MRIIGGKFKGHGIHTTESKNTRPLKDLVRESIFNLLTHSNKNKIPNTLHFIFGLKPQKDEFLFVYYLSVLSAYIVNKPDKIYFYYHSTLL